MFQSHAVFSQCHGSVKVEPRPLSSSTFDTLTEQRLKMAKVNLKNVKSKKRSNQENEKDGSHDSKKEQRIIEQDSSPKRDKSH